MTDNSVVLVQEAIREKPNEIPVFLEMLTYLNVEGNTVTADVIYCQRETCRRIIHRKRNYLFDLKETLLCVLLKTLADLRNVNTQKPTCPYSKSAFDVHVLSAVYLQAI